MPRHRSAHQGQRCDLLRPLGGDLQGDLPAIGGAHHRHRPGAELAGKIQDILGIVMRPLRHGRLAVAAEIAAHHPVPGVYQDRPLRIPHPAVADRGMQQDQRRAASGHVIRKHCWHSRPVSGCGAPGYRRPGPGHGHRLLADRGLTAISLLGIGGLLAPLRAGPPAYLLFRRRYALRPPGPPRRGHLPRVRLPGRPGRSACFVDGDDCRWVRVQRATAGSRTCTLVPRPGGLVSSSVPPRPGWGGLARPGEPRPVRHQ